MIPSFTSGCPTCADGRDHAVVSGHGDFEAAAECGAVDRHDDRLGAVLDFEQQRQQTAPRRFAADHLAELADVGARDEGSSGADDDDRDGVRRRPRRPRCRTEFPPARPGPSALTGGLSMVTIATPSRRRRETSSLMIAASLPTVR